MVADLQRSQLCASGGSDGYFGLLSSSGLEFFGDREGFLRANIGHCGSEMASEKSKCRRETVGPWRVSPGYKGNLEFLAVETSLQLSNEPFHGLDSRLSQPVAAWIVRAGNFVVNVEFRAELGKRSPELRTPIRLQFPRETKVAGPRQQNFADSLGRRGP